MQKLMIVSDYPPFQCGIAEYTRYLVTSMEKLGEFEIFVVSEGGSSHEGDGFHVYDAYSRNSDFKTAILKKSDEINPDVVHFQHAPDLFPNTEMFLALIESVAAKNIKVFVTLHTLDVNRRQGIDWPRFYMRILTVAHLIVHNKMSVESIRYHKLPTNRVYIIPHGTAFFDVPNKQTAKERLGFEKSDFIFLMFGFIHLLKNYHTVIRAFNTFKTSSSVKLLIAGRAGGNRWYNKLYIFGCKLLSRFSEKVVWHTRFIDNSEMFDYFAASDILLLPYNQNYPSASGIFHLGIGAHLPVLCSDSVKFSEIKDFFSDETLSSQIFLPTGDVTAWRDAMQRVSEDTQVMQQVSVRLSEYAEATSWDHIAQKHANLFRRR